jgi:hypothetical protein
LFQENYVWPHVLAGMQDIPLHSNMKLAIEHGSGEKSYNSIIVPFITFNPRYADSYNSPKIYKSLNALLDSSYFLINSRNSDIFSFDFTGKLDFRDAKIMGPYFLEKAFVILEKEKNYLTCKIDIQPFDSPMSFIWNVLNDANNALQLLDQLQDITDRPDFAAQVALDLRNLLIKGPEITHDINLNNSILSTMAHLSYRYQLDLQWNFIDSLDNSSNQLNLFQYIFTGREADFHLDSDLVENYYMPLYNQFDKAPSIDLATEPTKVDRRIMQIRDMILEQVADKTLQLMSTTLRRLAGSDSNFIERTKQYSPRP